MVHLIKVFILAFALSSATTYVQASTLELSNEQKIQLQSAMYQHIETNLVDGTITHIDLDSGNTIELVPSKAHILILAFEQNFILCTDFIDPSGSVIDVDFYIKPEKNSFRVFRMEIDNRDPIDKLRKEGRIVQVR